MTPEVAARAAQVARASYGRLVALLAARTGDLQLAEDCLGEAFARALRRWPEEGVPDNPEGWLLSVARNRQRDVLRAPSHRAAAPLEALGDPAAPDALEALDPDAIPDRRLALLFVCAHPAIDAGIRTPLMLQAVLGFEAKEVARAFAVPPATMAQRLVRAKRRIRDARIPFAVPGRDRMPARLGPVLEAVYGAYAIDWRVVAGPTPRGSLAEEALYLAETLAALLPDEPETLGLAALLCLSLSRAGARGPGDDFVPLEEQDPARWDRGLIARGEEHLRRAHALGRPGRFQLEAAIQSAHCARAVTGGTDWPALRRLYTALVAVAPTLGARVALAAAAGRAEGPAAGLEALDGIDDPAIARFQPAWATRAHLLAEAGRRDEAMRAYEKAISLTADGGARRYLEGRRAALPGGLPVTAAAGIPELTTERLRLRAFRDGDLDAYARICADPEVMRYLGAGRPLSREEAWQQMAFILGHWALRGFGLWAVEERATGALLGRIGLLQPEGWPGFELAWTLGRPWWGRGYATEGARAALRHAFDALGRSHVVSLIHPDNHASIRVAERIGEVREGETALFDHPVLVYGVRRPG